MGFASGFNAGAALGGQIGQSIQSERQLALENRRETRLGRETDIAERQVGVAERNAAVNEREADTAEARYAAEIAWNRGLGMKPLRSAAMFTNIIKKVPATQKALQPLIEGIDAGKIKTRGELRDTVMGLHASGGFKQVRVDIREQAAALIEKGKNAEAQQLMGLYEALGDDKFEDTVDDLMGKPYSLRRSASERGTPQVTAEAPYWDERTQSWLQRKSDGTVVKVVQSPSQGKGRRIYDAEGNLIYEEGGPETLTRKTQGTLEQKIIDSRDSTVRLENILNQYSPEFLTVGGKAKASLINWQAKFSGKAASPADKKYVEDFSRFAQDTVENINLYIKAITGAQMSEKEARRLRKAQPDLGDTWFTGDSPPQFLAKAKNALGLMKAADRRYQTYLQQGLTAPQIRTLIRSGTAAPLSSFMENQTKAPDVQNMTDEQIKKELGIQ